MYKMMYLSLLLVTFIGISAVPQPARRTDLLEVVTIDQCEGKDSSNYTLVDSYSEDSLCSWDSDESSGDPNLIACSQNGQKSVSTLKSLAESQWPAGAYYQFEVLYLAESGSIEGKYVYIKQIGLREAYLKKCSSVLGYSYVSTKSLILLILDKIDMTAFISPTGAFEVVSKQASTICKGRSVIV